MKFLSHYQSSLLDLEKKCCRSKETETSKDIPGFKHHRKKKKKKTTGSSLRRLVRAHP